MFARNRAPGRLVAMTVELAFISVEPPSEGERTLPHSRNSRKSLATIDQDSLLHPFTAISDQLSNGPSVMAKGDGITVVDTEGKTYIDAAAGLWCVNVGYGRKEIAEAILDQALNLAYFHSFNAMSNAASILLSERILRVAPRNMERVFFGTSGSDANDSCVKLIWYYNNCVVDPRRRRSSHAIAAIME